MKPTYALSEDVFACVTANRIVFLDLRRNRYLCLRKEDSVAVRRPLGFQRWKAQNRSPSDGSDSCGPTQRALSALLDQGLIEPAANIGDPEIIQINIPTVSATLSSLHPETCYPPRYIRQFVVASLVASWSLKLHSMQQTVNRVKCRKRKARLHRTGELEELLAVFERLRPLYGKRYVCLYDSLALLEFLARHGHFADWVFGVKADPFGAHCWLQYRDQVLNDSVDYVRNFTPIMVV